jgi:hypothetical protein
LSRGSWSKFVTAFDPPKRNLPLRNVVLTFLRDCSDVLQGFPFAMQRRQITASCANAQVHAHILTVSHRVPP